MISKYFVAIILVCLVSLIGGTINAQYIKDGYHWGFIFSHSFDLLRGKEPYIEIFLEYGFLQVLVNSLLIKIFGEYVFLIQVFIVFIYSISLFIIFKIILLLTGKTKLSFLSVLVIFLLYPWPTSPWPIYYSFFFSLIFIYFYLKESLKYSIIAGIALFSAYLSYTTLFNFIIFFLVLSVVLQYFLFKKLHTEIYKKHLYFIFLTFFLLFFIFIIYLFLNNFLFEWIKFQKIPFLVKESLEYRFIDLIIQYINFIFIMPYVNMVNEPQWMIYSLLFISNIWLILLILKNKISKFYYQNKLKLLTVCIFIFLLNFMGQVQNLMYISCSISAAIICFALFFNNIKANENKFIINTIMIFLTIFSVFNYEMKFSEYADSRDKSVKFLSTSSILTEGDINYYKYFKWDKGYWDFLNIFLNKIYSINKKCEYIKGVNLTDDVYLYLLINNETIQRIPFYLNESDFKFNRIFDSELINKIQYHIDRENIFVITHKNNDKDLNFSSKYSFQDIGIKSNKIIDDRFRIIYPKKCI
jgi:hypothetical protein